MNENTQKRKKTEGRTIIYHNLQSHLAFQYIKMCVFIVKRSQKASEVWYLSPPILWLNRFSVCMGVGVYVCAEVFMCVCV